MELKTSGIIFMALAYSIIITLISYCYYNVFRSEKRNKKTQTD